MKKNPAKRVTARQWAELGALARLPDAKIDTQDIPEAQDWSGAKRGGFRRVPTRPFTLNVDADLVAWFKRHTPKGMSYRTAMARVLGDHARRHSRARKPG